ncbi:MAG: hypothetical protein ACSHWW_08820 [Nonlabens sp.]|uniref:hypothetical protein n=1 Tax=Nonlabens sp. TaxID=1888209 RepID=UPI003EF60F8C
MTVEELVGDYVIEGHNQDESQSSYKGQLHLSLDEYGRVIAQWKIAGDQSQQGTGFFKDNLLVINFNYHSSDQQLFKGVVVYKCLTPDILEGHWSEEMGDPRFLGMERAYRVKTEKTLLH